MRPIQFLTCLCLLLVPGMASAADHEWSVPAAIPGLTAGYGAVAAAFADGELHVVTTGGSRKVVHCRLADGRWVPPVSLAYHKSGLAPDLAFCDGTLHMIGRPSNFKIWHSEFDGRAWLDPVEIPAMEARGRVGVTELDGILHITHGGMNMDRRRVFHAANSGWGWGHNVPLPGQHARSAAAMAGLDGTLHMVYVAKNSCTVWHTTLERWGEWTPPTQIPGVETCRAVDLVAANGRLFCAYAVGDARMGAQAPVAYCEFNEGRWDAPVTIEGYVSYGMPALAVEPGLPQQVHLFMTSPTGVLHMHTEDEVSMAPVKMKQMQRVK